MRIPCEDTMNGEMEDPVAPLISIRHMAPTLTASGGFDLCLSRYGPKDISTEKATVFMYVAPIQLSMFHVIAARRKSH